MKDSFHRAINSKLLTIDRVTIDIDIDITIALFFQGFQIIDSNSFISLQKLESISVSISPFQVFSLLKQCLL